MQIEVEKDVAYLTAGGDGIRIIDVSYPEKPIILTHANNPSDIGASWGLYLEGDLLYVSSIAAPHRDKTKGGWGIYRVTIE
ncbi:MAG: hypothetical protein GTO18_02220 [Anaerolineales bacterium]|nr:hypothetical protein [Anaerolineales bacterium]